MSFSRLRQLTHRSGPSGRSLLGRGLAALWLLVYVGVVAAAPVADGFVDHGTDVVVHIEDAEGGHCPASHGGESCDICQLAHGLRAVAAPAVDYLPRLADAAHVPTGARGISPVALQFLEGRSSRAPPLG